MTNIDRYYSPGNRRLSSNFVLRGLLKTSIEYDKDKSKWNLSVVGHETVGLSLADEASSLIGKHLFTLEHDNKKCSKGGEPYSRYLKLTGCLEEEFTCHDGQCISMRGRCNQVIDCRDKSDESECKLIVLDESYNKNVAPFIVNETTKDIKQAAVNISINLRDVIDISEQSHKITFKFAIYLVWYENRAIYHNLKEKISYNVFNDEEKYNIWTPFVIYENTDNDEAVTISEMVKSLIYVTRGGSFVRSGMDIVDEIEIFTGEENFLTMIQTYSKEFKCTYLINWFPFDTQVFFFMFDENVISHLKVCSIFMVLPDFDIETVILVPDKIIMSSDTELTQYFIKNWYLAYVDQGLDL